MGLGNLGKKIARIGRDTKNGVQKMSDSVSIRNRITQEKRSLERLFAVIGESVYKENPDSPRKGLEDEYAAVKVAYANIEKYSKQLDQVNGIVYCPVCGKPADPGDKFCAKCGARLVPEETTAAKVAQDFKEVGAEMGKAARNSADKTGEFFGTAAARTKNCFASLKDKSRRLFEGSAKKADGKNAEEGSGEEDQTEEVFEESAQTDAPDVIPQPAEAEEPQAEPAPAEPEKEPESTEPEKEPEPAEPEKEPEAAEPEKEPEPAETEKEPEEEPQDT